MTIVLRLLLPTKIRDVFTAHSPQLETVSVGLVRTLFLERVSRQPPPVAPSEFASDKTERNPPVTEISGAVRG